MAPREGSAGSQGPAASTSLGVARASWLLPHHPPQYTSQEGCCLWPRHAHPRGPGTSRSEVLSFSGSFASRWEKFIPLNWRWASSCQRRRVSAQPP